MASRGQATWVVYTAWNTSTPGGQTGDVANHTIRLLIDGVDAAPTNAPSEWSAANVPGKYKLLLTAAEAAANSVTVGGKSSAANVVILDQTITFEQLPTAAAGAASGVALVGSAMTLADGAITEAKITMPAEAVGPPSTFLQLMMWLAGMLGWRKVVKDATTIRQYMADGATVKTTSTYASAGGTDTIDKAT